MAAAVAVTAAALVGCAVTPPAASIDSQPNPPTAAIMELPASKYARGADSATVTIVEFADYQCPYCAREEPILKHLLHHYDGRVRLVYHDYPVGHPHSVELAEAARCAGEQGAFWLMHDFLFAQGENTDPARLGDYASVLGLDGQGLIECVNSGRYRDEILEDAALAKRAGARGTPTFFVNGQRLDGMQSYSQLALAVNAALAALSLGAPK